MFLPRDAWTSISNSGRASRRPRGGDGAACCILVKAPRQCAARGAPISHIRVSSGIEAVLTGSWIEAAVSAEDVVDMRRYLLVVDTDLLALDEKLDLEPINYLVERQEQVPCEVVVLSLVDTGQTKLSSLELVLGGASSGMFAPAKFPAAPRPGHDVNAAAEHRMNLAVRHLTAIGCQASGLISDEGLVKAVDAETRKRDYHEIILMTSKQEGSRLARTLHLDPVSHLQRRWGKKLTVFTTGRSVQPGH